MVLGAILGSGIGLVGGLLTGSLIFGGPDPKNFAELDLRADGDPSVDASRRKGYYSEKDVRHLLELAPAWAKWPDYERVAWINRMIATLWPYYNQAVRNIVEEAVATSLAQVCEKSKTLDCIEIEHMDLGQKPLRIGGIKTYETKDDEVIIEAPILWGSDARIRASAQVRLGPLGVYVPVEIRDIQLHAVARITIRPLVETLPCLGALYVSLLDPPHIDMTVTLINNIDLMAVPGIHAIAHSIVQKVIGNMMLYPNQFKVDLMEGGGLASPPCGMLRVRLIRIEGLKSADFMGKNDSYCLLEVREGRPQRSKTKRSNNPQFDEEFHLIVDDPESQNLKITVKDDDFGWTDDVLGVCEVSLESLQCIGEPGEVQQISVDLVKEDDDYVAGMGNKVVQITTFGMVPAPSATKIKRSNLGRVFLELSYAPFHNPDDDDAQDTVEGGEDDSGRPRSSAAPNMKRPAFARLRTMTNIQDDAKGVLTVTLTRCIHLAGKDTYVSFSLFDKEAKRTEIQRSAIVLNDNSPRWGDKFDFVMIHANSFLVVSVMEKPGFMESMMTMKFTKKEDAAIGKVRIPVKDVVRNGRLKDKWPLQEVQQGEVMLMLTWTPCEFA